MRNSVDKYTNLTIKDFPAVSDFYHGCNYCLWCFAVNLNRSEKNSIKIYRAVIEIIVSLTVTFWSCVRNLAFLGHEGGLLGIL